MARPKLPEKTVRSVGARICMTKAEYGALGRYARTRGKSISTLMRELALAALVADTPQRGA